MKKNIRKILVIVFIIISAIAMYIVTRGRYLEYKELGEKYISIFKTNLIFRYSIMAINFLIVFFVMYFANRGIKKGLEVFFEQDKKEIPKFPNKSIALVVAVITSIFAGIFFTPKVILYASNVSFEKTDLVFNLDISFYMFSEPLIKMILLYCIGIFVALMIYSAIYYIIVFNKYFDGIDKETLKNSYFVKHIIRYLRFTAILCAIYTLIKSLDIVFGNFVTTNGNIQLTGAGVTDISIRLWGNVIFAIVIIVSIFLATSNLMKNDRTKMVKNIFIIPAYLVCMFIVMLGFDHIFVNSNEYDREREYIERNISYTKEAYGINCESETIEYSGTITTEEINNNESILNNAVIVNSEDVLDKLNSEQSEKGYYTYTTAGITQYDKEEPILVYLSPREITNTRRTYNSKTFEYTHGYGAILTSATSTNEGGDIEYIKENLEYIKTPQIYYGLKTDSTVIVNSNDEEYDYTDSKGIEHTSSYDGVSGLNLGFFDRLILGVTTGNPKLAFSSNITKNSKILINRNIIKRAERVLPDLVYDENPYVVVDNNGSMYWILDAYTISSNYPYSTYSTIRHNGEKQTINYIRNSIKVIINCYDGSMGFYITDTTDPIAMAYRKMYPSVFEDLEQQIPADISENFVYPKFLYDIQSSMLEVYHNTKSEVLYRSDDSWKKATYTTTQNNKTSNTILDSYYTMVKDNQIGLVQIYSPNGKQNLTSYLIGIVEDGKNKLKISIFSSNESILGLTQLDSKIVEDETIKKEFDSLDVTGAKVTKQIMVVPVEDTILYIEQIYQTKTNESNIPYLKKVIVASGNKVAIGDNIKEALQNFVSQEATNIDTNTTEDIDGLIELIIKANDNLSSSINSSDWELMGSDIKNLQQLINQLKQEKAKEDIESTKIENVIDSSNENSVITTENTINNE